MDTLLSHRRVAVAGCCSGSLPHEAGGSAGEAPAAAAAFSGDPYGGYGAATLVVCPLVAVIQWGQEIARFTAPGTLKVASNS